MAMFVNRVSNNFGRCIVKCNGLPRFCTAVAEVKRDEETELDNANREAAIERSRNKSRLHPQHLRVLKGQVPYDSPVNEAHYTLKYKRKIFGRYGSRSGVDAGSLWPNKDDIMETLEYEAVTYPRTISESLEMLSKQHKEEERKIMERQAKIAGSLKKMDQWKKGILDKQQKKLKELSEAKAKRDALLDEVRAQFSFKIDVKDERFQKALAEKEKLIKRKMKEEKNKAKQERILSQLSKE